ncbi:erg26, C-3 sterol dehydrogenase [Sorochytrium milnesiophthora]
MAAATNDTVLVVGGDGFLGRHIVERLLSQGYSPVHVLDLQQRFPDDERVHYHIGSILDHAFLKRTLSDNGVTAVIHTASPPHGRTKQFYWSVNVDGTKTLVQACLESSVEKFVYTSSASVVFSGANIFEATEDLAYCATPYDPYTETKAAAEDIVLKSNNLPTTAGHPLLTCALRPSGIFGPRDGQMIPGFLATVADGKCKYVLGNGRNMFDFTYVENVAHAHILAMQKLQRASSIGGQAFNITNDEHIPFWSFNKRFLQRLLPAGHQALNRVGTVHIPWVVAIVLAYITEFACLLLSPIKKIEPTFSTFRVGITTANRTFNCNKAKRMLGYRPVYSLDDGIDKTCEWVRASGRWADTLRGVNYRRATDELVEDMKIREPRDELVDDMKIKEE